MRSLPYLAFLDETFWRFFGLKFEKGYTEDNKIILAWVLHEEDPSEDGTKKPLIWYKKAISITDIDEMSDGDMTSMDMAVRNEIFTMIGSKLSDMLKSLRNS